MRNKYYQRWTALILLLSMLFSISPLALADTPSLRAYCYGFRVTLDANGNPSGFGFNMGAQYGTEPYTLNYALSGGATISGTATRAGYVSLPGNFVSGDYTVTVNATDAAGAMSVAVMEVSYAVNPADGTYTQTIKSAVSPQTIYVNKITLNATALTLKVGETAQLTPAVEPANAANRAVRFESSDPGVATVSDAGVITALKAGSCRIVCTAQDGSGVAAECALIVAQSVTGITLSPASFTITEGGTYRLNPVILPADAANKEVVYASGNKAVVVVANDGTVTGVSAGVATITVSSKEDPTKIAVCTVTVGTPVGSVTLSPKSMELTTGTSMTLAATVAPETATNKTLIWSSSNTDVATVDASGRVTVWKAGTAVITATAADGSGKSDACAVIATGDDVTPPSTTPPSTDPTTPATTAPTTTVPTTTAPVAPSGETAYVRTEEGGLNLRVAARQSAKRLLVIPQNAALTIITKGTTWCYVWYQGTYGYVMTKFLSVYTGGSTGGTVTQAPPASGEAAQVNTEKGGLNLRVKPSQGATRLAIIPEDGYFTVVTYGSSWCYVYYNGTYGYVMTKFMRLLNGTETTNPPSTETTTPPPSTTTPPADSTLYATVVTEQGRLNFRNGKSQNAGIIGRIDPGQTVAVLDYGSTWCKVTYDGKTGYVMTKFLAFGGSAPEGGAGSGSAGGTTTRPPESDGDRKYAQVVTEQGKLNLRRGMSTGAAIIGRIPQYAYVEVLTTGVTWCYVSYNGNTGYVMTKFLSFAKLQGSSEGLQPALIRSSGNIYQEQSTSSTRLAEVAAGDYVYIYTDNGTWARVLHLGKIGYISSDCITLPEGVAQQNGTPVYADYTYSFENDSAVVGTLNAGDKVQILHCYGDTWWKVRMSNGTVGYVVCKIEVLKVSQW